MKSQFKSPTWLQISNMLFKSLSLGNYEGYDDVDPATLFAVAKRHKIRSRVAEGLSQQNITQPLFIEYFSRNKKLIALRLEMIQKISKAAQAYNLPFKLIKGFPLEAQIYDRIGYRDSADDDFLVDRQDLAIWNKILLNIGFRQHMYPVKLNAPNPAIFGADNWTSPVLLIHNSVLAPDFRPYECEEFYFTTPDFAVMVELKFGLQGQSHELSHRALYSKHEHLSFIPAADVLAPTVSIGYYLLEVYQNTFSEFAISSNQPRLRDYVDIAHYFLSDSFDSQLKNFLDSLPEESRTCAFQVLAFCALLFDSPVLSKKINNVNENFRLAREMTFCLSPLRYLLDDKKRLVARKRCARPSPTETRNKCILDLRDLLTETFNWGSCELKQSISHLQITVIPNRMDLFRVGFRFLILLKVHDFEKALERLLTYVVSFTEHVATVVEYDHPNDTVRDKGSSTTKVSSVITSEGSLNISIAIHAMSLEASVGLQRATTYINTESILRWHNVATTPAATMTIKPQAC